MNRSLPRNTQKYSRREKERERERKQSQNAKIIPNEVNKKKTFNFEFLAFFTGNFYIETVAVLPLFIEWSVAVWLAK